MLFLENFAHLNMTSEGSKRRDFLALVFISKLISKKTTYSGFRSSICL